METLEWGRRFNHDEAIAYTDEICKKMYGRAAGYLYAYHGIFRT